MCVTDYSCCLGTEQTREVGNNVLLRRQRMGNWEIVARDEAG